MFSVGDDDYRTEGKNRFGDYIPTKYVRGLCKEHSVSFRDFLDETYINSSRINEIEDAGPTACLIKVDEIFDWLGY